MPVRDIMTRDPACCTPDTDLEDVARLMVEHDCGAIPVVDSQASRRLLGIVTDRDIVCRAVAQGKNPLALSASDVMTKSTITVSENADIEDCALLLRRHEIRRMLITDTRGRLSGIVAIADLARSSPGEAQDVVEDVSKPAPV